MKQDHFSSKKLRDSFSNAFRGWRIVGGEQSFMIQLGIAAMVIILGFAFHLSAQEFAIILLLIAFVLILEILNTIVETLLDFIHPKKHPQIGLIKDATAGLVLLASIVAVIIGLVIFIPHL